MVSAYRSSFIFLDLGAAFLRAARFTFLRSSLSSIFFVSATWLLSGWFGIALCVELLPGLPQNVS